MSKKSLTNLRLKGIATVSFQRSESTNLMLYKKEPHYPGDLADGEAFLFLSRLGNQVVFIFRSPVCFEQKGKGESVTRRFNVVDSRRLRLSGGSWHPYMLQNYANEVGIHLVGIKRFEQVYQENQDRKRAKKSA